jgi:hypothetical protein
MKRFLFVLALGSAYAAACGARAEDVDSLKKAGFVVVQTTFVSGDFHGCELGARIQLDDGNVFVCRNSGSMFAHHPQAVLLKNSQATAYKLVINGSAFDGELDRDR